LTDGKWYIYFAAGRTDNVWAIRMYVLENGSANPLSGTWTEKGRIATPLDTFSLDATTFVHNGTRYLSWAQNDPAVGSGTNLYLARMSNPWTISGTPARISVPTHAWETVGHRVNEGPAVIIRNGRVFMAFSASATDSNYCLGLLTASASSDLMNPVSWSKNPQPVFRSKDGQSDTRLQKLYWNADGTPNFGIQVSDGVTPYRFASHNFRDRFIRHYDYRGRIDADVTNLADSQFRIVPGLAGGDTVSLESANLPGYYLRHRNYEVWVQKDDGSALFKADASFHRRAGLADPAAVSFESSNLPGRYIRHYDYLLHVQTPTTATARADATFHLE
jgi:hypothetical protein